ncbi:Poly(U)-specific endoribonuclease-B (Protein endoU-B) (Uridylate-specific endoribonuclease-B) [Durusdinium trenchii]|uniref:Poly(U)-specific endoribonuclease-B (Protein endoU-B) (Uridylate-specific endoribonuclease-B) n=1 Tax=Durusdinium trenchii TaxID=1381693 RepID=A0ABP0RQP3_9DINO
MGFVSLFVVLMRFVQNLQMDSLDGAKWGSFGGLVMPSFFFQGAQDIFSNVRKGAAEAQEKFQESGRFEDIYQHIQQSQREQVLCGLDALRERFPRSKTRERIFERLKASMTQNTRFTASIYDLALRLQPPVPAVNDIYSELWLLDENRCTASGRQPGQGKRPWVNGNAQILIDTQVPASRLTDASMAQRALFAWVAPEVLAKPTLLYLVKLFDVFQHLDHQTSFSQAEEDAIDDFIKIVSRTAVMRRAFRYAVDVLGLDLEESEGFQDRSWQREIRRIWFTRGASPCAFEHIFVGNLSEDSDGHPVAGGLHCWLKFYLEELRGTAKYLGYFYNRNPKQALADHRYISGKFTWMHAGRNLVKEGGGFFVGVSPEWLLANGTLAYLETRDPGKAESYGWQRWLGARDRGYTKDVVYEGFRYRKVVCHSGHSLVTVFSSFLGVFEDDSDAHLDRVLPENELAQELPKVLVSEGLAHAETSELCAASVRFCAQRHCHSLGEALQEIRDVFGFSLEATMQEADADPALQEVVQDAADVLERLEEDTLNSHSLPVLIDHLKQQGRSGARLHRPLRLLLTGHPNGARVVDLLRLLELAEAELTTETGFSLRERLTIARTWENCLYDLEMDLKGLSAVNAGKDLPSVEPVAHLMNFRDAIMSLMLQSLLFKKAVLDWDLKSERAYADGPMVAMSELAVNIFSKTESLPYKFRPPALPTIRGPGPFTKKEDKGRGTTGVTSLQCHLLAVLREMQFMGKGLRNMDFAEKVHVSGDETGQNPAAEELAHEMAKWSERCTQLERELTSNKGERENQMESKVEELEKSVALKETANKKLVTSIHKLEGEVQSLRYEFVALQRERSEVTEQNNRIAKESLPVIEKMRTLVDRSKEATERLTKDSAIWSRSFRRQVQETERILAEKDDICKELERAKRQLQTEKEKNDSKEVELQKKETLYLRTMAARKSIQDSFNEQREQIAEVEQSMEQMELDRQELLKVIQGKDGHIRELEEDLRRAKKRIAEMEQQRDMALQEYTRLTGKILDLSSFKVVPTLL